MKPAARKYLLPAMVLLVMLRPAVGRGQAAPTPAPAPPSSQRDLLAHGTDQLYWSADVVPTSERRAGVTINGVKTTIRAHSAGQPQWREITTIAAQARDLGNRGSELLVAMEGGDWKIVTDDGVRADVRSGVPLPASAHIRAICGDEEDIWAVGVAERGQLLPAPVTSTKPAAAATSSSAPSTASTAAAAHAPATLPTPPAPALPPHEVGLFLLRRGQWVEQVPLPGAVRRDDLLAVSLAVIDRKLMLAMATRDLVVRVYSREEGGTWDLGAEVGVLGDKGEVKLLALDGQPALWLADGDASAVHPGMLLIRGQRWSEPIKLASSPKLAGFDRRALTTALGRIGLLASDGRGRLKEQMYDRSGALSGEPTDAVTIARGGDEWLAQAFQFLAVLVLVVWMLGSMRQRPAVREAIARSEDLHLAPLARRLVGGLIDMIPLVIGFVLAAQSQNQTTPIGGQPHMTYDSPAFAWLAAGVGTYLLLTTAVELITRGRSLGKMIAGTKVAMLDSSRPVIAALLIRNLLRLVDLMLMFFPLSFVIFSPLRQRVGDMAGGTMVVSNDAPELPPSPPREEEDEE